MGRCPWQQNSLVKRLRPDRPSLSRCFSRMKEEEKGEGGGEEKKEEEEEAARTRESLSACVLKELGGEAEPGSGPRTRFHWGESGDRKVTSPMARIYVEGA